MAHDEASISDAIRLQVGSAASAGELRAIADRLQRAETLEAMGKDELVAHAADEHNVELPKGASKADLVAHIAAREHGVAPGEIINEGTPLEVKGPGPEWSANANG